MRLFVAIDVPDSVKEHLSFVQRTLPQVKGVRFVHPKNIHLTLNFLGEVSDVSSVVARLDSFSFSPFFLTLNGVGFFPSRDFPRVAWVGLKRSSSLFKVQRGIDLLFKPNKSFKPHLTIARIKNSDPRSLFSFINSFEKIKIKPLSFKVDKIKLYRSTLTPLGPVYDVIHVVKAVVNND